MDFQSFDFERTCWQYFQKRTVLSKLDIYDCIITILRGIEESLYNNV